MKNILELSDNERYEYLITTSVKQKEIWLLQAEDGMIAMLEDGNGQEYIPVWPSKEFAQNQINEDWADYEPDSMKIYEFMEWMKELAEDKIMIAAFPNNNNKIIPLEPLVIKQHLQEELERR